MGCGTSRSPQASPVTTAQLSDVDTDNWMFYAPQCANQASVCFHCGQPNVCSPTRSFSMYSDGRSYTPTSSRWDSWGVQSAPAYVSMSPVDPSSYSFRSRTPSPQPRSSPTSPYTPQSTPAHSNLGSTSPLSCDTRAPQIHPSVGPSSSGTYTSRSYSLLSTPTFHSPSSHPRNDLTLDPALFSNNMSPFATKIDTDCASRFSGTVGSSSGFTSPASSRIIDSKRYPLTPLSVRTEPFPKM